MNDMELNMEHDIVKMLTQIGDIEKEVMNEGDYQAYVNIAVLHMIVMHFYNDQQEALDYAVKMWGRNGSDEG